MELEDKEALANRVRRKLAELKEAIDEANQAGISVTFPTYGGQEVTLNGVQPNLHVEL